MCAMICLCSALNGEIHPNTDRAYDIHAFLHNRVYFFEKLLAVSSQQRLALLPRVAMDAHVVAALKGSHVRMIAQCSLSCSRYTV